MWSDDVYLVGLSIPQYEERVRLMRWLPDHFGLEAPNKEKLIDKKFNWNANTFYSNYGKIFVYVRGRDRALKLKLSWMGAVVE